MAPKVLLWKNKIWESSGSNLGDLAIITATVEALRREIPDVQVVLLSDDPAHTESLYPGVVARRFSLSEYVRTIREVDLVVLGGGTLFSDDSSMAVPVNTSAAYIARWFGTPVVGYGPATGRLHALSRALTRGAVRRMAFACLRDAESAEELARLAPDARPKLHVTEDVAFSLRPDEAAERRNIVVIAPRRIFHYGKSILPFAIRKRLGLLPKGYFAKMEEFKSLLAEVADHVVDRYDADVVFLPMYSAIGSAEGTSGYLKTRFSSRDDQVCEDIRGRMRHADRAELLLTDKPREVLSVLASARMLLGVPLHSLILSHVAGTPIVGLSYQGKVERFMRRAGLERFMIHVESIDCPLVRDEFVAKVDACLSEESSIRATLQANNAAMRAAVDTPARMVAELLAEGGR